MNVMNVLFVIHTPGGDKEQNCIALVPTVTLSGVDLDSINGKIVNDDDIDEAVGDAIVELYNRFGLERQPVMEGECVLDRDEEAAYLKKNPDWTPPIPIDLQQYLNPEPPFTVDRVVFIGWAV